ncbi:MAG: LysR family transcriptional regulator [Pseudomonadota bacterium]
MSRLNYHHLRYFRAVAREGNLTRAAGRLNLSQSALSTQIRDLEQRLGHDLFDRQGRQLMLTEAGRIALDHADRIFGAGEELLATLARTGAARPVVRVGAAATLSRNFQLQFLGPLLAREDVEIVLKAGDQDVLLDALRGLTLDVVLGVEPPPRDGGVPVMAHRVGAEDIALHGVPSLMGHGTLAGLLSEERVILPTESPIRSGFDALAVRLGVRLRVAAEVDDMAMVRLLAREGVGLAVAPALVLADEIAAGVLVTAPFDLGIRETFYAMTVERQFPNPAVGELLGIKPLKTQV